MDLLQYSLVFVKNYILFILLIHFYEQNIKPFRVENLFISIIF